MSRQKVDKIIRRFPQSPYQLCTTSNNKSYGFMALQRRRNYLECHYCGNRSSIQKDGTVQQWECKNCDAMNYYDADGEVADPPTADTSSYEKQNSNQIQYAQNPRRPGLAAPQKSVEEALFCSDCLRNQQLFTTSLAQYLPDDSDPDYEALYKNYYKFRRNLEKRYPQICADCEPRVTARMQQAGYVAKTDCLQRMLDKSKKRRLPGPSYKFSWASLFDFFGLLLWTSGLSIQILWNVLGCFGSQTATALASLVSRPEFVVIIPYFQTALTVPPAVLHFCSLALPYFYSATGAPSLIKTGLILSAVSIWWNPEYKNSVRGFNAHITGYQDWYKMQVLSLLFRFPFFVIMRKGWFGDSDASGVRAAHSFLIIITLITSFIAYKSIHVDHSRIFVHTPEKLKRYVQPKPKPEDTTTDISAQLFSRHPKPQGNRVVQPLFPQLEPKPPAKKNINFNERPPKLDSFIRELNSKKSSKPPQKSFNPNPSHSFNQSFTQSFSMPDPQSSPLAIKDRNQLAALENLLQPNFGPLPVRAPLQDQAQSAEFPASPDGGNGMDWEPINSSPFRAFQPPTPTRGSGFGNSPVLPPEEKGAFWYRVPPAPRSQNAKIRNPAQPVFVSNSGERKENFFQSMGGRQKSVFDMGMGDDGEFGETEMAQPKFFPPQAADDGLADLMSQSFSLKEKVEEEVHREEEEKGRRWWHFFFVMVVVTLLGGYVYFFKTPSYEEIYQELVKLSDRGGELGGDVMVADGRSLDSEFR